MGLFCQKCLVMQPSESRSASGSWAILRRAHNQEKGGRDPMRMETFIRKTNLGAVKSDRFTFIRLPLNVKRFDSSPIRAIAIEE